MTLQLSNNELSGIVPNAHWGLPIMIEFSLHSNNLSEPFSTSISTTANLTFVSIANNKFNGTIPSQIGLLSLLQTFDTSNNTLSGLLPIV